MKKPIALLALLLLVLAAAGAAAAEGDFSDPNRVFRIQNARVIEYEDDSDTVRSVTEVPLEDAAVSVREDVALLLETADGWITDWDSAGELPLAAGQYRLAGTGDLSAGAKVLAVETDGSVHAFVSGGTENGRLKITGRTADPQEYIEACRIKSDIPCQINKTVRLPDGVGEAEVEGKLVTHLDVTASGSLFSGVDINFNRFSEECSLEHILVKIKTKPQSVIPSIPLGHFAVEIVSIVLELDFTPKLFVEADAEGEVGFTFDAEEGFSGSFHLGKKVSVSGFRRISREPGCTFVGATVSGEIYSGLEWGPGLDFFLGAAGIECVYKGGVVVKGTLSATPFDPEDNEFLVYHACDPFKCINGTVFPRVGPLSLDLSVMRRSKELVEITDEVDYPVFARFYHSFTYNDGDKSKGCPHHGYRLEVTVKDGKGNLLKDAEVGYAPYEKQLEKVADGVKINKDDKWLLYVPSSNPTGAGQKSNTVTVTAKVRDPLNPSGYVYGTAEVTEKGLDSHTKKPDPEAVEIVIDMKCCVLSFEDTGSGTVHNMPGTVYFHPSQGPVNIPGDIPEKSGLSFAGWNTQPDGTGTEMKPGGQYTLTDSTTLYAQWKISSEEYAVVYNANGGTWSPPGQMVPWGESVRLRNEPALWDRHTFMGWALAADADVPDYPFGQVNVLDNPGNAPVVMLYAVWYFDPVDPPVRIHYDMNGGPQESAPPDRWIERGSWMTVTTEPVAWDEIHVLLGWSTDPSAAEPEYLPGASCSFSADTVLYAVWKVLPMCELSFEDPEGNDPANMPEPVIFYPDLSPEVRVPDDIPVKSGRHFTGWNTEADGSGAAVRPGALITLYASRTLYARWEPIGSGWVILFNANGGESAPSPQSGREGESITLTSAEAEWTGFIFLGWSREQDADEPDYPAGKVNTVPYDSGHTVLTLYAVWGFEPVNPPIRIRYDMNGGPETGKPADRWAAAGTWITLSRAVPVWDDRHLFLGWSRDAGAKEAEYRAGASARFEEDTVLYAVWKIPGLCELRFEDPEGNDRAEVPDPISFDPEVSPYVRVPDMVPVKSGRHFTGWNTKADGSGRTVYPGTVLTLHAGQTLYAQWELIGRNWVILFNANGGESAPHPQLGTAGKDIVLTLTEPKWAKHRFLGWSRDPESEQPEFPAGRTNRVQYDSGATVLTLYAVWEFDPVDLPVRVSYDMNGGPEEQRPKTQTAPRNSWMTLSRTVPVWDGQHLFLGWSRTAGAAEAEFRAGGQARFDRDTVLYAVWRVAYHITEGSGSKWIIGKSGDLRFVADGDFRYFTGVRVDGRSLTEDSYDASAGSTVVVLNRKYLSTLSRTAHSICIDYRDGSAEGVFYVERAFPVTGDEGDPALWAGLVLAGLAAAAAALLLYLRSRRKR